MPEASSSSANVHATSVLNEHRETVVAKPFDRVLDQLVQGIVREQLWVIHQINPQELLRKDGHEIGRARQILFFHPRYMVRVLASDRRAVVEAPLKFVVLEQPNGGVLIMYHDPAQRFAKYDGLTGLGEELRSVVDQIVSGLDEVFG